MRSKSFAIVALLVTSFVASSALADAPDPAGAEALYRSGKELAKHGDYAAACPKFAESQRHDPAPGTLLNLADCEEHVGQLARAWDHFVEAESSLPRGDSRIAFAHERAAKLEKRVPRMVVRLVPGAPANTLTTRDAQELGPAALGVPLPVDPGEHVIATHAPGRYDARITVRIAEGETREVLVLYRRGRAERGGGGVSVDRQSALRSPPTATRRRSRARA